MFGFGHCDKRGGHGFGGGFGPGHGFGFGHHGMHHGGGCGPGALFKELGLSDQQLERIAELKIEGLGQFAQMKLEFGRMMKGILGELTKETINKAKIHEIAEKFKTEKAKFGDSMLERMINFAETLTPEQRKKLKIAAVKKFLGVGFDDDLDD